MSFAERRTRISLQQRLSLYKRTFGRRCVMFTQRQKRQDVKKTAKKMCLDSKYLKKKRLLRFHFSQSQTGATVSAIRRSYRSKEKTRAKVESHKAQPAGSSLESIKRARGSRSSRTPARDLPPPEHPAAAFRALFCCRHAQSSCASFFGESEAEIHAP